MLTPDQCNIELEKPEFDDLARKQMFTTGPFSEDPARIYGAPYIARKHLRVFGQLHDNRKVWAWRYPEERDEENNEPEPDPAQTEEPWMGHDGSQATRPRIRTGPSEAEQKVETVTRKNRKDKTTKYCAECGRGENGDVPAIALAIGHDGDRPFRKYVCDGHMTILSDDHGDHVRFELLKEQ